MDVIEAHGQEAITFLEEKFGVGKIEAIASLKEDGSLFSFKLKEDKKIYHLAVELKFMHSTPQI